MKWYKTISKEPKLDEEDIALLKIALAAQTPGMEEFAAKALIEEAFVKDNFYFAVYPGLYFSPLFQKIRESEAFAELTGLNELRKM